MGWLWGGAVAEHTSLFVGCSVVGYLSSSGAFLGMDAVFGHFGMVKLFDIVAGVVIFFRSLFSGLMV